MRRGIPITALVLAMAFAAEAAVAQTSATAASSERAGFELASNYPNPFTAGTTIPYTLGSELFSENAPVVVTLRIFDLLANVVAHPMAVDRPSGAVEVRSLEHVEAGRYEAFWDGSDGTGAQVPAGVYILELTVNEERALRRMVRVSDLVDPAR